MAELAQATSSRSTREVMPRDEAVEFFESIGEHYKAEIIASIPADEPISLYREGDFIDLCRGPHVPSTGKLKVFKLMKVAGAYWRGDSKQRDAPAHLRHRVGEEGGPGRLPAHARGGREARPPQARHAARPLPHAGRGAGHGVLASEGLDDLAAGRAVHAPRLSRQRLPGSARARRSSTARCGSGPGTGTTTRRTCSRPSRRSATTRSSR